MWQVIESTATFVQGIIYFWFLSRLLDSKYDRRTTNIGILVTAVIYMLADMYSSEIFGRYSKATFYVVILLYVFLNFKNTLLDKFSSFIAIEMIIAFVAQFLVYTFSFLLYIKPVDLIEQKSFVRVVILVSAQILSWIIATIVLCMAKRWSIVWKDKKVLIVSLFSIIVIWGLRQIVYLSETNPEYRYIIGIFAGVLSINMLVLYIVGKFYQHEEELRRYEIQVKNSEEVYRINEESRKLRHDMKNMLLISIGYLEDGKPEKAFPI